MELKALNRELRNRKASYVIYLTDNINKEKVAKSFKTCKGV